MNNIQYKRRDFLRMGIAGATMFVSGCMARSSAQNSQAPFASLGAIGPLQSPDANGVRLPRGFKSRVVARSGQPPVMNSNYNWHGRPDGGACYAASDGGWIYVSNAELSGNNGGVGALRFSSSGEITDAYPILEGTNINCAGGPTPWGTWLSCEEHDNGQVFECDPQGQKVAIVRPALGTFKHEAVAVDMAGNCLYLTEDLPDGGFYRFRTAGQLPDLTEGQLEVAKVTTRNGRNFVQWQPVSDPLATNTPTRQQVEDYTPFAGGEGIAIHEGRVFFTTKVDNRVWALDVATQELEIIYDLATSENPILSGVDNVVISPAGDVLVAEDGGDMQLVLLTATGEIMPLLQIVGHDRSEIAGPAFDPSFQRLYFSSQRGSLGRADSGITYEISRA